MVKNNQNFVKKMFLLLKYQKLLIFVGKKSLKKMSYFSRCFYMESPIVFFPVSEVSEGMVSLIGKFSLRRIFWPSLMVKVGLGYPSCRTKRLSRTESLHYRILQNVYDPSIWAKLRGHYVLYFFRRQKTNI